MPGWLLLLLAGNCLLDFQVDHAGQQHLEEGLQKILHRLQKDLAEGLPAKETNWASKKFSVDPKENFLSQQVSDGASGEAQIGLWSQSQNDNFLASAVPDQLPHRVNRGTGCQIWKYPVSEITPSLVQVALEVKATMASTHSTS